MFAGEPEDIQHVALRDRLAAKRDQLIEHRLGVAQAAIRAARDRVRGGRLELHLLFSAMNCRCCAIRFAGMRCRSKRWQRLRMVGKTFCGSVVAKMNFTCAGGSSSVLSSALKAAEREHVHFVDDVDFVFALGRRVTNVVAQLAHLFDAVVARAVDLEDVEAVAAGDFLAAVADAAGRDGRPVNAVERLGQNARGRGLPDPARADKKIGVREAILLDGILQRARDVLLPDEIVERLRPIFPRENLVAHATNLVRREWARKQKFGKADAI